MHINQFHQLLMNFIFNLKILKKCFAKLLGHYWQVFILWQCGPFSKNTNRSDHSARVAASLNKAGEW